MTATPATRPRVGPALTEVVNTRTGSVQVSGHLTVQGANLLRGTVEGLHRSGHVRVLLDLRDVQGADDAGLHVLRAIRKNSAAVGGELVVRDAPEATPVTG